MGHSDNIAIAYQSIDLLNEQIKQGYKLASHLVLTTAQRQVNQVLVCGMGGSALAADIVRQALSNTLQKPVYIVNGYELSAWVNKQTLVVITSYSGNTQETLECFKQARTRRVPIVVITSGGTLAIAALKFKTPLIQFNDKLLNPSHQPRLGIGFSIGALVGLLEQIRALPKQQRRPVRVPGVSVATVRTLAGRMIAIIGVGYLGGAAHAIANCINENSKTLAAPFSLPEVDHHLLEGLSLPKCLPTKMGVVMLIPSRLQAQLEVQRRATITILNKHRIPVVTQRFSEGSGGSLAAAIAATAWGARLSIALADVAKLDPLAIPWVTWLKQQGRK
jgi:glucose/mannose-6-phosphate isomerase